MSDEKIELVRLQHAATEKKVYFLLASAGAAIGFAMTQTNQLPLEWPNQPIFAAIALWCMSFLFGLKALRKRREFISANSMLLHMQGENHPSLQGAIKEVAEKTQFDPLGKSLKRSEFWQLATLAAGAVSLLFWKVSSAYSDLQSLADALSNFF